MGIRQNSAMTTARYGWVATRGIGTVEMFPAESCVTGQILAVGAELDLMAVIAIGHPIHRNQSSKRKDINDLIIKEILETL